MQPFEGSTVLCWVGRMYLFTSVRSRKALRALGMRCRAWAVGTWYICASILIIAWLSRVSLVFASEIWEKIFLVPRVHIGELRVWGRGCLAHFQSSITERRVHALLGRSAIFRDQVYLGRGGHANECEFGVESEIFWVCIPYNGTYLGRMYYTQKKHTYPCVCLCLFSTQTAVCTDSYDY